MTGGKHTPWLLARMNSRTVMVAGPDRRGLFKCLVMEADGEIVAEVRGKTAEEAEARAHRVAAAPDLLEALEKLKTACEQGNALDREAALILADEAIIEARGIQP